MVSLRRRRLLGLCCGPNGYMTPLPFLSTEEMMTGIPNSNAVAVNERSIPVNPVKQEEEKNPTKNGSSAPSGKPPSEFGSGSPSDFGSLSPRDPQNQSVPDQPIKRRKRHRRKQVENQEPCLMRGVYFKNMKWQAAIKVDKKQIHLGTVSSQEEAARLYDRAAFMCGREPNFELSEVDKQELRKFSWDEFLTLTRRAITNKKCKRRIGLGAVKSSEPQALNSLLDGKRGVNDISGSEEPGQDSSSS